MRPWMGEWWVAAWRVGGEVGVWVSGLLAIMGGARVVFAVL